VRAVRLIFLLAAALSAAACGGSKTASPSTSTEAAGNTIALVQGTSDYAVGPVRSSFLFIDSKSRSIERPTASVHVLDGAGSTVATTEAHLQPIGVPGSAAALGGVRNIYVAHFRIARPGRYTLSAVPAGTNVRGVATIQVASKPQVPAVGDKAIPSRTPTLSSAGGETASLTTANPPDRSLLRYSVADSVKAHAPFVLAFATPKFCTSRTCGPTVDVVQAVQKRFAGSGVRFIHVEIYQGNNPAQGFNRWVKEWRLPSEPYVFLVGRDGRIKQRFEGSVSVAELSAAVRSTLAS
jgi:hypothetical protein